MRRTNLCILALIWSQIIAAGPAFSSVKLQIREGRPIVDGVYINGHGPYRFLVDTGTNVNLIEAGLARKIGMAAGFQVGMASAAGKTTLSGSNDNEISLDTVKAAGQEFLFSELEAIHHSSPDVRGVLGTPFLSQFDYTLDVAHKLLRFGQETPDGTRSPFQIINARPVLATSLGNLALDTGNDRLLLFGIVSGTSTGSGYGIRTLSGSQTVGKVSGKPLLLEGRKIWDGDAVAIPDHPEPGVDGLMPLSLFRTIYVCNSGGYIVFR